MTTPVPEPQNLDLSDLLGIYADAARSARLHWEMHELPIPPEMLPDWSKRAALALGRMADAFAAIDSVTASDPPAATNLSGIYADAARSTRLLLTIDKLAIRPEMLPDWSKRAALALGHAADLFEGLEVAQQCANTERPRLRG